MSHRTIRRPPPPNALRRADFPAPVVEVLRTLDDAGHRSWLVGGAVRDLLLRRRRPAADLDVATPARPEQVVALFPRTIPTGIEHGTVTVLVGRATVEVTTFRGEGAYVDGRRPASVTFLGDVDDDLSRRDFTVNAMAWDPIGQEFRDPFGGQADLRRRVLRAVGDPAARFAEDGLRPLRAARFSAELGFSLARGTAAAIPAALPTVRKVAVERVMEELSRLLVAPHVRSGLHLLARSGLLEVILPDLAALPPRAVAHALEVAAHVEADAMVRWAALLHVLGGGGEAAGRAVARVLAGLRASSVVREGAAGLVERHRCLASRRPPPLPADDPETRRWLARAGDGAATLLSLARAEVRSLGRPARRSRSAAELASFERRVRRVLRAAPPLTPSALALDGRAVMEILCVPGGPAVGAALRHLLDRVLTEPAMNTRDRLTSALQEWWRVEGATGAEPSRPGQGLRPYRRGSDRTR